MGIGFGGRRSHGDHRAWRQPPLPERLRTCQGKLEVHAAVRNVFLMSWGPGGPSKCAPVTGPYKVVTREGRPQSRRDLPRILLSGGLVSHLGLGLPRRWSSKGPQRRVPGALTSSPTLGARCKKRRRKKEPPLWTVDQSLYWAVALRQNSRGRVSKKAKGVCEV